MSAAEDKIFPSEILWQSWCRVVNRNSVSVSNLRAIVGYFIIYELFKRVIQDVLTHSSSSGDVEDYLVYTELDDGFFAVLASVKGLCGCYWIIDKLSDSEPSNEWCS